jgi:hypothetical protein
MKFHFVYLKHINCLQMQSMRLLFDKISNGTLHVVVSNYKQQKRKRKQKDRKKDTDQEVLHFVADTQCERNIPCQNKCIIKVFSRQKTSVTCNCCIRRHCLRLTSYFWKLFMFDDYVQFHNLFKCLYLSYAIQIQIINHFSRVFFFFPYFFISSFLSCFQKFHSFYFFRATVISKRFKNISII